MIDSQPHMPQDSAMPFRKIYDQEQQAQFVTFSCYRRRRILENPVMRDVLLEILAEKLSQYQGICSGYVIMPDHVHAIVWFQQPGELSRFMKSWKQTSSLKLKPKLRGLCPKFTATFSTKDPFWQAKYYPFNLYSQQKAKEKLNYMHLNPVKAGLVANAVDWKSSSARYYLLDEPSAVPLEWIF